MHIMHTVFIISSRDTCIFFCSSPPKIFHNIFLWKCSKYFSRIPVQECIKVYFNRCLSKESKSPWNQLLLIIYNELNGFDLSPSEWHFNRDQNRASTWFLKWPLYWGQQIADGDQPWFVEQILNVQLDLRPTMKSPAKT